MLEWNVKVNQVSALILLFFSFLSFFFSLIMMESGCLYVEWEVFNINSCGVVMSVVFDWMSLMFLSLVSYISSMVFFYSGSYMKGDINITRFMYLVVFFVMCMWLMIISPNLISVLLGWDGLGLISYVLVVYYQHEKSAEAGMLTVLSNRVGDVGILLGIGMMSGVGGWSFVFYSGVGLGGLTPWVVGFVILAGLTKSAQFPFSAWLPAAMAAPTPVSALVHSSTLVTAGVYILIRFSELMSSFQMSVLLFVSSFTMLMASLAASVEYDLKKIIALSTLSQLGLMMAVLAIGRADLAFFHLIMHALFKALLFMCAGSIIHNCGGCQDIRFMGCLYKFMPITSNMLYLANLALIGFPFLAGYYSKDLALEVFFSSNLNKCCLLVLVLSTFLTSNYSFRLYYYLLLEEFSGSVVCNISEDMKMIFPMYGLGVGAVVGGSCFSLITYCAPPMICLNSFFKMLAIAVSFYGVFLGTRFTSMKNDPSRAFFLSSMWYIRFLSNRIPGYSLVVGKYFYKYVDTSWLEFYGARGLGSTFSNFSRFLQLMQENKVKIYLVVMFMWFIFLICI
uniref:NADH-ubiquinone oxidoreductase chain 5 n=1 Tax=Saron marmoratus TaxID=1055079 RepID=A0A7G7WQG9_9EUCA|nr:NADH dehydrogenase subunit 5 [Saron marmoratus]QNH68796.1 NADH dehydrogenase subunit 5 [Saron marmoratus]